MQRVSAIVLFAAGLLCLAPPDAQAQLLRRRVRANVYADTGWAMPAYSSAYAGAWTDAGLYGGTLAPAGMHHGPAYAGGMHRGEYGSAMHPGGLVPAGGYHNMGCVPVSYPAG